MKFQPIVQKVRHQAGVTILEFIAFVGLAALVIAGALSLYGSGSAGQATNDTVATANGIVASLRSSYPNGTASLDTTKLGVVGAPAGWGTWSAATNGGKLTKGARGITVATSTTAGFLVITLDAGDANLCTKIFNSSQTVGGRAPSGACTNNQLVFNNVSLP